MTVPMLFLLGKSVPAFSETIVAKCPEGFGAIAKISALNPPAFKTINVDTDQQLNLVKAFRHHDGVVAGVETLTDQHGSNIRYVMPNGRSLWIVGEHDLLRNVAMKTTRVGPDGTIVNERADFSALPSLSSLIGPESIFQTAGARWQSHVTPLRKALASVTSDSKTLGITMETSIDKRAAALRAAHAQNSAAAIDLTREFNHTSFDILMRSLFGMELSPEQIAEVTSNFGVVIRQAGKELKVIPRAVERADDAVVAAAKVKSPEVQYIDRFADRLIAQMRTTPSERLTPFSKALITLKNEDGSALNQSQLRDQVIFFLAAGHETPSTAMTTTMTDLLAKPALMAAVRNEVRAMQPQDFLAGDFAQKTGLLDSVIDSSLRSRPPTPIYARRVTADFTADSKTGEAVPFKKGDTALLIPRIEGAATQTMFDLPPGFDVAKHIREKLAEGVKSLVFGAGPRVCMGRAFAQIEMRTVLARFLRDFDIRPATETDLKPTFTTDFSYHSKTPLKVMLSPPAHGDIDRTYKALASIPLGAGDGNGAVSGTWQFVMGDEKFVPEAKKLFENVYNPMGLVPHGKHTQFLKAQLPGENSARAVLGITQTPYGLRVDHIGHDGSKMGIKMFAEFLRVRGVDGMYMELKGAPLMAASRGKEVNVVDFDRVLRINESAGVIVRKPTAEELAQAVKDKQIPDDPKILENAFVRVSDGTEKSFTPRVRVMLGRPFP